MEAAFKYPVGNLHFVEFVNSGSYGSVHKAQFAETGRTVAVKVIHVTPETKLCAEREVALSCRLKHENIIETYDVFAMDGGDVALVQEFADGGDLFDFVNQYGFGYDEDALKSVFGQVASAVAYLHENGVSHRDIKPENVALTQDRGAKLIDFGLSEESRYVRGRVGTDPYCAPEVVQLPSIKNNKCRGRRVDGFAADIYSLGLTLVAMITGRLPWRLADDREDDSYASFLDRLLTYEVEGAVFADDPRELGVSSHLCKLLDSMLHPDPKLRATIGDVLDALDMPWFTHVPESEVVTGALETAVAGSADSGIGGGFGSYGAEEKAAWSEDEDEALGEELPPLPTFLMASA